MVAGLEIFLVPFLRSLLEGALRTAAKLPHSHYLMLHHSFHPFKELLKIAGLSRLSIFGEPDPVAFFLAV